MRRLCLLCIKWWWKLPYQCWVQKNYNAADWSIQQTFLINVLPTMVVGNNSTYCQYLSVKGHHTSNLKQAVNLTNAGNWQQCTTDMSFTAWWFLNTFTLITAQNMPKTSNSNIDAPIKTMVARGNQMVTKDKQWWAIEVLSLSTNYNGYNCSK